MIHTVSEARVVREPPCADEGRRICLALGFVGQNASREKGALRVARSIAELDGVSLRGIAQGAAPGLLLVLIVAVVNQRKRGGVVAAVIFVVAGDIGCRNLHRYVVADRPGERAMSGRILVAIQVWVDAVDLPRVEAVGFQL